jgi:hypothetical protein
MNNQEVIQTLETMKNFSDAKADGFAKTHKVFEDESKALVVAIECMKKFPINITQSELAEKYMKIFIWLNSQIEIAESVGPAGYATLITLNEGLKILEGK